MGESDGQISGPLGLFIPDRHRDERHNKAEIRTVRVERDASPDNRRADHIKVNAGDTVIIEERSDMKKIGDITIRKNRKGRLEMVR